MKKQIAVIFCRIISSASVILGLITCWAAIFGQLGGTGFALCILGLVAIVTNIRMFVVKSAGGSWGQVAVYTGLILGIMSSWTEIKNIIQSQPYFLLYIMLVVFGVIALLGNFAFFCGLTRNKNDNGS